MRLGIFGSSRDAQTRTVKQALERRGVAVALIESQGLNQGVEAAFTGDVFWQRDQSFSDVGAWYLRHIMAPLPPAFAQGDDYLLYRDWYVEYMRRRERFSFQLSWLIVEAQRGVPIVNPPEHGGVVQLKPFQLWAARQVGMIVPPTLITNNPQRVRSFAREYEQVVYKPSMGGGLCRLLDDAALERLPEVTAAPVTFQQRIQGMPLRLTFIGEKLVSAVRIESQALDYRADPHYSAEETHYTTVEIPPKICEQCRQLMQRCGLLMSGIDFMQGPGGDLVFIEANSSPIYLDIENKTGASITEELVSYLLWLANDPDRYQRLRERARKEPSFVSYALPFDPRRFFDT